MRIKEAALRDVAAVRQLLNAVQYARQELAVDASRMGEAFASGDRKTYQECRKAVDAGYAKLDEAIALFAH